MNCGFSPAGTCCVSYLSSRPWSQPLLSVTRYKPSNLISRQSGHTAGLPGFLPRSPAGKPDCHTASSVKGGNTSVVIVALGCRSRESLTLVIILYCKPRYSEPGDWLEHNLTLNLLQRPQPADTTTATTLQKKAKKERKNKKIK